METAQLEDNLGSDHPEARSISIAQELSAAHPDEERYTHTQSNRTLILECRADFQDDGSVRNWCVEKLTDEDLAKQWKGPRVITSKIGSGGSSNPLFYEDFNIGDMALVREFLGMYILPDREAVRGVRIRCLGEKNVLKRPAFESIGIEKEHEMFNMDCRAERVISVSRDMGIPIVILNAGNVDYAEEGLTVSQKQAVEGDVHFTKNPAVMFLTLDTDVKSRSWGALNKMQWGDNTENVIVARVDMKPLSPRQVEALVRYCRYVLYPVMQKKIKQFEGQNVARKMKYREEVARELMCQAKFEIYFKYLKKMKQIADSDWAQERSPFGI
ncbi:hypothetical protein IFR05_017381 [Cadophora sp. M221]|nr:hypothetical protein IFR05_017381 [Cadophora sp. M221]